MSKVWAWVAGIVVSLCIVGLVVSVRPARHDQRAAYWAARGDAIQHVKTTMPPGHWLLVRRIPRP